MSNIYSRASSTRLSECHFSLQFLFHSVLRGWDHSILTGHREQNEQMKAFQSGASALPWDKSKHNKKPSLAVDAVSYPIDWEDWKTHYAFGGYVCGVAAALRIPIRWGGDWDRDHDHADQKLMDLVHFELIEG